jgi:DNA polymerase-3 subunit delta'
MKELYPWQNQLWQRWAGLRSRLPHAILLRGAQGTGKLDFALNVAQSLLCEKPLANGFACEDCPSCHWFEQESHPDFRLLQPDALTEPDDVEEGTKKKSSRQISVDQIRTLSDFANLSAHRGGHRVVLIHPAEAMNTNAANALLKTLEEPSPGMLIILVSHKPQQLLPTILSRCISLATPMPSIEESAAWLKQQGIRNPAALLAQAGFAPLNAARLAEESAGADEHGRFLQEIRQPAQFDIFALAERLQKAEPGQVVHWLQQWCYDLSSAKLTGKIRYNTEYFDYIKKLSEQINPLDLQHYQKELLVAKREALHPLNQKLQLESLLLSYRQMMLSGS